MDTHSIYEAAVRLLDRFEDAGRPVRLTGVSVAGLTGETVPTLFPDRAAEKRQRLEGVISNVAERFGALRLTRAELLTKR